MTRKAYKLIEGLSDREVRVGQRLTHAETGVDYIVCGWEPPRRGMHSGLVQVRLPRLKTITEKYVSAFNCAFVRC